MIPFDFQYYRPASVVEAVQNYLEMEAAGKSPKYYGGGTELISMARMNSLSFGAVIDIKDIPECNVLKLLAQAGARVADHTIQKMVGL